MCVCHTEKAEKHWQEDKAVCHSQQCDDQIQPEEKDLNELSFGKRQHDDPGQVGHSDSSEHLSDMTHSTWISESTHTVRYRKNAAFVSYY